MTSNRAGCGRCIAAHLELAVEQALHALLVLEYHHQVNAFHSYLQTPASAGKHEESWSAPTASRAACSHSLTALGAHHKSAFYHVRNDRHALGVIHHL